MSSAIRTASRKRVSAPSCSPCARDSHPRLSEQPAETARTVGELKKAVACRIDAYPMRIALSALPYNVKYLSHNPVNGDY